MPRTRTVEVTDLQRRILRLIEEDHRGVKAIADELGVYEKVVKRSVVSLGKKLGVPLPQMPAKAREMGVRI